MKIHCDCGATLHDADRSRKAHLIPDQSIEDLMDEIDRAIETPGGLLRSKEGACMRIRKRIIEITRSAWQCPDCARLYLDDPKGELRAFDAVEPGGSGGILQGPADR